MTYLRSIPLTLLISSQAVAFQPLARSPVVGVRPTSCTRPSQSTVLSAFKTETIDARNVTERTSTPAFIQEALLQEDDLVILPPPQAAAADEKQLNGALFDLSEELVLEEEEKEQPALEGLFWKGSVVLLCALWASNFPMAKLIMSEPGVDSSLYALTRFSVAALALTPGAISATRKTGMDWETFKGAVVCGSWVSFGYLGQTLGLMTTTASKSCVICSLHCVFVAAIAEWLRMNKAQDANALTGTNYDFQRLLPAAIAVAGVAVVELNGASGGANIGDALSFAQPLGFGLGYLLLEDLMAKRPDTALAVSAIKLGVVALSSFAMFELAPLVKEGVDAWSFSIPDFSAILASPVAMGGIFYTGVITTALALWIESIAFARVSAKDASLILTTEPLFAAGLGAVTLGETFGMSDYFGASLIIGACVLATLMDSENRDESCKVEDEDCQAPRQTPLGGM